MPFVKNYDQSESVRGPVCIHLRSKAIYVTGDLKNPEHPDEEGSHHAWCNMTQNVKGPDREDCDSCRCTSGRQCYQESYDV
jgi:hypothetical protein